MKKKNNVMMIAVIAITLLMIGCVVVMGIIRNSNRNNPDVKPPEQTTDTTDTIPDQTTPEIPPITDSGTETDKPEDGKSADITIDVVRPKDDPHEDTPGVVGDVVIQPGIKEGEE